MISIYLQVETVHALCTAVLPFKPCSMPVTSQLQQRRVLIQKLSNLGWLSSSVSLDGLEFLLD